MVKSPSWSTPVTSVSQAAVPIAGPETGPRPRSDHFGDGSIPIEIPIDKWIHTYKIPMENDEHP